MLTAACECFGEVWNSPTNTQTTTRRVSAHMCTQLQRSVKGEGEGRNSSLKNKNGLVKLETRWWKKRERESEGVEGKRGGRADDDVQTGGQPARFLDVSQ